MNEQSVFAELDAIREQLNYVAADVESIKKIIGLTTERNAAQLPWIDKPCQDPGQAAGKWAEKYNLIEDLLSEDPSTDNIDNLINEFFADLAKVDPAEIDPETFNAIQGIAVKLGMAKGARS